MGYNFDKVTDCSNNSSAKWDATEEFFKENVWLCHSPSIVTALSLIVQAFSEKGDKIIVQPPVYSPFMTLIQNHNREVYFALFF